MELIYNPVFLKHQTGMHPENGKRLEAYDHIQHTTIKDGTEYLELIHTPEYINHVKESCLSGQPLDRDTMTSPGSFQAAVHAVGATIMASESGDFALVRPPGHHAYSSKASGFCLFNNIAIASQKLVNEGKRVFLFDFDGHLGDGTSHIFEESDQVFYCSIHQWPAFPGHGYVNEIGTGKGKGFTMNLPLPPGSGDDIYLEALDTCMIVLEQFKPDVIAVSAGFDSHLYDLLLDLRITESGFYTTGNRLAGLSSNIFATLEGGYNVELLPKCIESFVAGINGEANPNPTNETTSRRNEWEEFELRHHSLLANLRPYWKFS